VQIRLSAEAPGRRTVHSAQNLGLIALFDLRYMRPAALGKGASGYRRCVMGMLLVCRMRVAAVLDLSNKGGRWTGRSASCAGPQEETQLEPRIRVLPRPPTVGTAGFEPRRTCSYESQAVVGLPV